MTKLISVLASLLIVFGLCSCVTGVGAAIKRQQVNEEALGRDLAAIVAASAVPRAEAKSPLVSFSLIDVTDCGSGDPLGLVKWAMNIPLPLAIVALAGGVGTVAWQLAAAGRSES